MASEPFIRYWKYLRLINHKPTVVGEFEFKLSPHFSSCGFTVGSIATPQLVAEYLINLEDAEKMRDILSFQCTAFPSQAAYIRELQNGSSSGLPCRDQLAEAIRDRGLFTATYTLHPWISEGLSCNFVKKSNPDHMDSKRTEIRRLRLHEEFHPTVKAEIERWDIPGGRGQ